jgi:hypothetical protein
MQFESLILRLRRENYELRALKNSVEQYSVEGGDSVVPSFIKAASLGFLTD